jgi:hypothetical protein
VPDKPGELDDVEERLRMFSKLFLLFPAPRGPELEAKIAAYVDETSQVPPIVLSHALSRLVKRCEQYAPSVADILRESARVIREAKLASEGRPTHEYNGHAPFELNVERWLARGREVAELLLPAGLAAQIEAAAR